MKSLLYISAMAWIASLGIGIVATMLSRFLGRKFGIVDAPDGYRKVHKEPIPITGGHAILVAFVGALTTLYFTFPAFHQAVSTSHHKLGYLLAAVLVAFGMGVWDDVRDLKPRYKLLLQTVAALLAYYAGFRVPGFTGPFGQTIYLGVWSLPVTVFWFLGCMNVINLLDGLDGLAGGVGFFVSLTLAVIGIIYGNLTITVLSATLCGAIMAFLIFNFNPASIFLGDGGSMLIGFCIATMSLTHNNKAETTVALVIPFIALGLPVFDTVLAMLRRWSRRVPIFASDRKHVHHVLLELGLSQRKVVVILYSICATLGGTALLLTAGRNALAAGILALVGIAAFVAVRVMDLLNFSELKRRVVSDMQERSLCGKAGVAVEKAIHMMAETDDVQRLWVAMTECFECLGLHHAQFEMGDDAVESHTFHWQLQSSISTDTVLLIRRSVEGCDMDKWSLFLNVHAHGKSFGTLEVWRKGEEMPIRDTAMLINKLRHALGTDVYRLSVLEAIRKAEGKTAIRSVDVAKAESLKF